MRHRLLFQEASERRSEQRLAAHLRRRVVHLVLPLIVDGEYERLLVDLRMPDHGQRHGILLNAQRVLDHQLVVVALLQIVLNLQSPNICL